MAKNKLSDLNDHLFAQLERLNDEELTAEQIDKEVCRSKAIVCVADKIIKSSKVALDAMRLVTSGQMEKEELPDQFTPKQLT